MIREMIISRADHKFGEPSEVQGIRAAEHISRLYHEIPPQAGDMLFETGSILLFADIKPFTEVPAYGLSAGETEKVANIIAEDLKTHAPHISLQEAMYDTQDEIASFSFFNARALAEVTSHTKIPGIPRFREGYDTSKSWLDRTKATYWPEDDENQAKRIDTILGIYCGYPDRAILDSIDEHLPHEQKKIRAYLLPIHIPGDRNEIKRHSPNFWAYPYNMLHPDIFRYLVRASNILWNFHRHPGIAHIMDTPMFLRERSRPKPAPSSPCAHAGLINQVYRGS